MLWLWHDSKNSIPCFSFGSARFFIVDGGDCDCASMLLCYNFFSCYFVSIWFAVAWKSSILNRYFVSKCNTYYGQSFHVLISIWYESYRMHAENLHGHFFHVHPYAQKVKIDENYSFFVDAHCQSMKNSYFPKIQLIVTFKHFLIVPNSGKCVHFCPCT